MQVHNDVTRVHLEYGKPQEYLSGLQMCQRRHEMFGADRAHQWLVALFELLFPRSSGIDFQRLIMHETMHDVDHIELELRILRTLNCSLELNDNDNDNDNNEQMR